MIHIMTCEEIFQNYKKDDFLKILKDNDYGEKTIELCECCYGINCPSDMNLKDYDDCFYCDRDCKECWMNAIKDVKFKDKIQEQKSKINNIKINENLWNEFNKGNNIIYCKTNSEVYNFVKFCKNNGYTKVRFINIPIIFTCGVEINKVLNDIQKYNGYDYYFEFYSNNGSYDGSICTFYYKPKNIDNKKIITYSELFSEDILALTDKEYSASEILHMIEEDKLEEKDNIIYKNQEYCYNDIKNWTLEKFVDLESYKIKKYEPKYVTFDEAVKSGKRFKHKDWTDFRSLKEMISEFTQYGLYNLFTTLSEKVWIVEEE